jgi:hypothetical protein
MAEEDARALAHRRWKQSDITTLRNRLAAGDDPAEVSRLLDRSPESVQQMMNRLRLY